jgi:hypothetical protein
VAPLSRPECRVDPATFDAFEARLDPAALAESWSATTPPGSELTYTIDGTGTALVSFMTPSGPTRVMVPLPWSITIPGERVPRAAVIAQLQGNGSLTCSISRSGPTPPWGGADGSNPIATCSE